MMPIQYQQLKDMLVQPEPGDLVQIKARKLSVVGGVAVYVPDPRPWYAAVLVVASGKIMVTPPVRTADEVLYEQGESWIEMRDGGSLQCKNGSTIIVEGVRTHSYATVRTRAWPEVQLGLLEPASPSYH